MHRGAVATTNAAKTIRRPEVDQVRGVVANGPGQKIRAAGLVRSLLRPYTAAGVPVGIDIDEVCLSSDAASTLARVIHELATNSARHGALSTSEGRVSVTGRMERDNGTEALGLTWQEEGGPPVRAPERGGLETVMLSRAVAHEHGGQAGLKWREEGLFYELRLPLS